MPTDPIAFQQAFFARCPMAESVMGLFEHLPQAYFYAKDEQSRFVRVNHAFRENHGVLRDEQILGRTDHDFHPPMMAEAYIAEDRRVMADRKPIPGQVWLVGGARRPPLWYVSSKAPLFDPGGEVVGIAGVMYRIEGPAEEARFFQELTPVIRHIEARFTEPIVMSEMAAMSGLSPTHFNRRFRQLVRMTPTQYLLSIRIEESRRLLVTTTQTLSEIAHRVGFSDQSHLTKRFKQATGMTPAAYRRRFRR